MNPVNRMYAAKTIHFLSFPVKCSSGLGLLLGGEIFQESTQNGVPIEEHHKARG